MAIKLSDLSVHAHALLPKGHDQLAARLLGMSPAQLEAARERLIHADLIAYGAPLYQVLELPEGGAQ